MAGIADAPRLAEISTRDQLGYSQRYTREFLEQQRQVSGPLA